VYVRELLKLGIDKSVVMTVFERVTYSSSPT